MKKDFELPLEQKKDKTEKELEDLDNFLRSSFEVLEPSEKESSKIQEGAEILKTAEDKKASIKQRRASRFKKVRKFDPWVGVTPKDYEILVENEMLDKEIATKLGWLDELVERIGAIPSPSEKLVVILDEARIRRRAYWRELFRVLRDSKAVVEEDKRRIERHILRHHAQQENKAGEAVGRLSQDPRVVGRLEEIRQEEKAQAELDERKEYDSIKQESGGISDALKAAEASGFKHKFVYSSVLEDLTQTQISIKGREGLHISLPDIVRTQAFKIKGILMQYLRDTKPADRILSHPEQIALWTDERTVYNDVLKKLRQVFLEDQDLLQKYNEGKLETEIKKALGFDQFLHVVIGKKWADKEREQLGSFWVLFQAE